MKNNFYKTKAENGVCFYRNRVLDDLEIVNHAFSTKDKGVSENAYSSLNLGVNTEDAKEKVFKNFNLFSDAIGVDTSSFVLSHQVHSANIRVVTKDDCGKGVIKISDIKEVDALISNENNVALATFYADCTPLLMVDIKKRAIASVHSGSRGTLSKIAQKTVLKMADEFSSNPKDIICVTGPSIKKCHFEVGKEVYDEFFGVFRELAEKSTIKKNDKFYIDTDALNKASLLEIGLLDKNIHLCPICTFCERDTFFSHRGDKGTMGRMCAVIELK